MSTYWKKSQKRQRNHWNINDHVSGYDKKFKNNSFTTISVCSTIPALFFFVVVVDLLVEVSQTKISSRLNYRHPLSELIVRGLKLSKWSSLHPKDLNYAKSLQKCDCWTTLLLHPSVSRTFVTRDKSWESQHGNVKLSTSPIDSGLVKKIMDVSTIYPTSLKA